MDEARFRALIREAIGEESMRPWLASAVRTRLAAREPARRDLRLVYAAMAAVVALLAAALVVPQLVPSRSTVVVPATSPSPVVSPTPAAVDPASCTLPVSVEIGSGPPAHITHEYGFVDTQTGRFTVDGSASLDGLPYSSYSQAMLVYYSRQARRWLPSNVVSPDGLSYAWVRQPSSTRGELHVYDLISGSDRTVWTAAGDVIALAWDTTGIQVDSGPPNASASSVTHWLVDPVSATAARLAASQLPPPWFTLLPTDPREGITKLGSDGDGRAIFWFYNLDRPGSLDWVFYESAPGQRVTIYRGTQGDATAFDPTGGAMGDATGVWFADNVHHTLFHWREGGTLTKVAIGGLPPTPSAPHPYVDFSLSGPCF
jgi:hypothetical protein